MSVSHIGLPPPPDDPEAAVAWVARHLGDLCLEGPDGVRASQRFRGGQAAADGHLGAFSVRGYAGARNQVWPLERRGASALSPYIRYGLLPLRRVWDAVSGPPKADRTKFRDELLWQEYARHVYARLGGRVGAALRFAPARGADAWSDPWPTDMACMAAMRGELETDGWVVNQARMWMSSQWVVRAGREWREGEDRFFRHLLDGSRAANRLGWQWTIGSGTGRPYGFSRWQVEKRAPELCGRCALRERCPIQGWPDAQRGEAVPERDPRLRADPDLARTRGPLEVTSTGAAAPEAVWLTAESLGDADPALAAHPELPALFVFDAPLLARLRLSGKRLVFLAETLGALAARRPVTVMRGDPVELLAGRRLAVTFAPVPGFRRRSARLEISELHPWPWLAVPHDGPIGSYSAWRKPLKLPPETPSQTQLPV